MKMKRNFKTPAMLFILVLTAVSGFGQTTAFTYQGRISDSGVPANGLYDIRFRLYGSASGGGLPLGTNERTNVQVAEGVFTVTLDFGANAFNGNDRFLEIAVRPAGGSTYTALSPLPQITSVPYSVRSQAAASAADANQLGGIAANQYVQTNDPRLSDDRNPMPNSPNYIRNSQTQQANSSFAISGTGSIGGAANIGGNLNVTGNGLFLGDVTVLGALTTNGGDASYVQNRTTVQPGQTNFNISGNGILGGNLRAANLNALSAFQFNGTRILHVTGSGNLFAGFGAGNNNSASNNTFIGSFSGVANTSGSGNTFVGRNAGNLNNTGANNTFSGDESGEANTTGSFNAFFGADSGNVNSGGSYNSFFGYQAGLSNTSQGNSFFGAGAGSANTSGELNAFFGRNAGIANTTAAENAFFGAYAGQANTIGTNNSFFGAGAGYANTTGIDNSYFGRGAGQVSSTASQNVFFGTTAGGDNVTGSSNSFIGRAAGGGNTTGNSNVMIGKLAGANNTSGNNNTIVGANANVSGTSLQYAAAIGAESVVGTSNTIVLGRSGGQDRVIAPGLVAVGDLFTGGSQFLCYETTFNGFLSTCSSSLRYKHDIEDFKPGLAVIHRLRPVTFKWNSSGAIDVGFVAEEVNAIDPLFSTYNKSGQVEGVKYPQLTTVLVNAVREQQEEIESLRTQVKAQRAELLALKALVCAANPGAAACEEEK